MFSPPASVDEYIPPEHKVFVLNTRVPFHMSPHYLDFFSYEKEDGYVRKGNGTIALILGKGTIVTVINGHTTWIENVHYVPGLDYRILSVPQLKKKGIDCRFSEEEVELVMGSQVICTGTKTDNKYTIEADSDIDQ